jgi:E3 ubiquitin-protein ligase HECTD1
MIQDLMIKGKDEFLEHFARLGVFSKVAALAGPQESTPEPEAESNQSGEEQRMEDAKELLIGRAYHWRDWCICRGRDCLYIWSDAAALELSNGSNGWFRFILDGKLATMYSSGSPEGGTDTSGEHAQTHNTRTLDFVFAKVTIDLAHHFSYFSHPAVIHSSQGASFTPFHY